MKRLRKILRVSWTAKTNEWVLNRAGVKKELLKPRLHDTTCCHTGCQTGMTTGGIVYTNIQPVVKPVVQPDLTTG